MSDNGVNIGTITSLLRDARSGHRPAYEQLFVAVQGELRRLAQSMINDGAWAGSGINGTELVSMACAKLLAKEPLSAEDRRHFFFLLGRAMHDVLVEEARARGAQKRGGGHERVSMVEFAVDGHETTMRTLDLHEALKELGAIDAAAAQVVHLRYFGGCTLEEAGDCMGCSVAVVRRQWDYAKAWLAERLGRHD